MASNLEVVIPFQPETAKRAAQLGKELGGRTPVILAGEGPVDLAPSRNVQVISGVRGKGRALQEAFLRLSRPVTVLHEPRGASSDHEHLALSGPIAEDRADVVYGVRPGLPLADRGLARLSRVVADVALSDPLCGRSAFRSDILKGLTLASEGSEVDSEILVKVAAQMYRITEVPVAEANSSRRPLLEHLRQARTLIRYATTHNDTDNLHEGYNTLARIEGGAPHYNAWLGRRFREYCGRRVLEIGAGIGTITSQLEAGRELLIALEVDTFYTERLKNRFRDKPHVRPYLSDVALADWKQLREEHIDSIVLSNVLEHIPDDADAVRRFRQILPVGGRLIILVPALPALFGSMDEAVGHHRRYSESALRSVLENNGFALETLEWMNLVGIPGWFVNGRLFRRRAVPPLQLRLYDQIAPLLARAESKVKLPVGMSLFAVARGV